MTGRVNLGAEPLWTLRSPRTRPVLGAVALAVVVGMAGCEDPTNVDDPPRGGDARIMLSNPGDATTLAAGAAARAAGASSAGIEVVYISLVPGTVVGQLAEISNERTGALARTAMANRGFDPIPLAASAGDTVLIRIWAADGTTSELASYVPRLRSPIVVRTSPPDGKRDVVLNSIVRIVFSEPMDPATISGASVSLGQSGGPVAGRVQLAPDGLSATFVPDRLLLPETTYTLSVTTGASDLSGEPLESAVGVSFSTGTTTALATAFTNPAALFSVTDGLRTFEFEATLHDDGRVTGRFFGSNPASGGWGGGPVSCFRIVDGRAWVAGVFETGGPAQLGVETGWMAVDNVSTSGGIPDLLSFAVGLDDFGTPQDFCDSTPAGPPPPGLILRELERGDIVVSGATPLPPPAPEAAHLVFAWPPPNAIAGRPIAPAVEVRALDAGRLRTAAFDGSVTLTLAGDPGVTLTGTTTVLARDGVARFDDLVVSTSGSGYRLVASAGSLPPDTSEVFAVLEPAAGRIAFHDAVGIRIVDADGSGLTTLVSDPADGAFSHTQPAWSPDGSRIAFRSTRNGNADIYVMNVDGSAVARLTRDSAPDDAPEWSPDGSRIVFTSDRGGWPDLYDMNADGTDVRRLTNDAARDVDPVWSPDGTHIAFASDRHDPGANLEIYVMGADGSQITRLTQSTWSKDRPDWSPDGSMIAYRGSKESGAAVGVYLVAPDGTTTGYRSANGSSPSWSPDGSTLVYPGADGLRLIRLDSSVIVSLGIDGYDPDWAPAPPPGGGAPR